MLRDRLRVCDHGGQNWRISQRVGASNPTRIYRSHSDAIFLGHDEHPDDPAVLQHRKLYLWGQRGFITPSQRK